MNLTAAPLLASFADAFGLMDTFHEHLADVCFELNEALILFSFTFAFAGLLLHAYQGMRGGSLEGIFGQIVATGIVASIIPLFPGWLIEDIRPALSDDLLAALGLDPIGLFENFGESFGEMDVNTDPSSLMTLFVDPLAIIDYIANIIAAFCMIVIGLICYVIFFFAYQVQIMALYVGAAVSPIFFGMFLFEQTRETAIKYFTGLIGIVFWPLGWGLGLMLADELLTIGIDVIVLVCGTLNLMGFGIAVEAVAIFCLVIAVAIWIMFVIFKAPALIHAAVTSGAQIGTAFASQAVSAAMGGASAGVAVSSSIAGMSPVGGETMSSAISGVGGAATGLGSQIGGIGSPPPKEE